MVGQLDSNTNHLTVRAKSCYWEFTLNNYSEDMKTLLISESEKDIYDEFIVESEVGKNGTPHFQGFIKFKIRKELKTILNSTLNQGILKNKLSFRVVRNIEACKAYVQKDNTVFIKKEKKLKITKNKNQLMEEIAKSIFKYSDMREQQLKNHIIYHLRREDGYIDYMDICEHCEELYFEKY